MLRELLIKVTIHYLQFEYLRRDHKYFAGFAGYEYLHIFPYSMMRRALQYDHFVYIQRYCFKIDFLRN